MIRMYLILVLILGSFGLCHTQNPNIGIPFIDSYSKEVYKAGGQNKEIRQDHHGLIYVANNNGLMSFDGSVWKTYPLPNSTIVRSVEISDKGVIYVGGQNEFGRFIADARGELVFESLKEFIPEAHRDFEDVWDIVCMNETVYFRASNKLYKIEKDECEVINTEKIIFLGYGSNNIFIQTLDGDLRYLENGTLRSVEGTELLEGSLVSEILEMDDFLIIATTNNGLFKKVDEKIEIWKTEADEFLKKNHIVSAAKSSTDKIVFGTDFAGALVLDKNGKSEYLLNSSNSLLNNKVISAFFDKSQNLWLGVDNGINYIQINSPFSRIFPDEALRGTGFAAKVFNDKIYLGTNNGLYVADWKEHYEPLNPSSFELVKNTKGQNWGLDIVGDELLLGHNKGAFSIDGNIGENIFDKTGVWSFEKLKKNEDYAIAGTFENFVLFKNQNGRWVRSNEFDDWFESCRFVEQDDIGNIWVSHPYKGVFKIQLNEELTKIEVKKYGASSGLPSDISNHLFKIKGEIVFCGERGIYLYNAEEDAFYPYKQFNEIFGSNIKIRRFFEGPNDDIWFVTKDIGVLKVEDRGLDKKVNKKVFPQFKNQLNAGFESVYVHDEKNVFITCDKGFIHYNPSFKNEIDSVYRVIINKVVVTDIDSIVFSGHYNDKVKTLKLDAEQNAIQFNFSATDYMSRNYLEYRYFLEGDEKKWSEWSSAISKEYTNLFPGEYTFKVQARNQNQILSPVAEYSFEILAPWYASTLAYTIYSILAFVFIGGVIRAYQKKYYGLKEDRDQTIKESAKAIDELKEQNVKAELEYKQRELTSTAMHVVQKNKTLQNIKEQLVALKKMNKDSLLSKEIQKMINMLQQDEVMDDGWDQFMLHFSQLHGDYFNRLKSQYPELTPKDLKLCTYLRMNLSTKEIASLLNVTTRGIEASRYRLRKKINLDKEENLTEFLMRF